ncbi:MAG: excinuclease ABC subunit UvrC [Candidatus Bipolaricaulota bacterium]
MQLKNQVAKFPQKSGVYLIESEGEVVYIGKASSLRDRVQSYFYSDQSTPYKIKALKKQMTDIDYIVTDSEVEALILEESLIKEHQPKFNIQLKDNKRYPYVKIIDEKYPRIKLVRRRKDDGADYFGPYTNVSALRETLKTIEELTPVRRCSWNSEKGTRRPCLRYHMGTCPAPCAGKISREEYLKSVESVQALLQGNYEGLTDQLVEQMEKAASEKDYERAARWRDRIRSVKKITAKQKVRIGDQADQDYIAVASQVRSAMVQVFFVRNGNIKGQDNYELALPEKTTIEEILDSFLVEFYRAGRVIPAKIYVPATPTELETITTWLEESRGSKVDIHVPQRGKKRQILLMAKRNAHSNLERISVNETGEGPSTLAELAEKFDLPHLPDRIEGYDISNISGSDAVGSMVVFEGAQPKKPDYRKFRIQEGGGPDDYKMLQEILRRRLNRGFKNQKDDSSGEGFAEIPDLIVIDGGKGQLQAARNTLQEFGLGDLPLLAIAKQFEEVFLPHRASPVQFEENSEALKLLQRIRDEAHRFAVSYHRRIRQKRTIRSSLDSIDGVGPKRKKALLNLFGSTKAIGEASLAELKQVPNLPAPVAERVYDFFQEEDYVTK